MELSMYTTYALNIGLSPYDAFCHFYKNGVRYADILDCEFDYFPLHLYSDYLRKAGIIPDALISLLDITSFENREREKNIANIKGYIDQMEKLSMSFIMLAPEVRMAKSEDELKRMKETLITSLAEVSEYAKGSHVKVTIENQSNLTRADSKTEDIRYILDSVPDLGFVLDSGNFFCIGEDVLKAYDLLSDKIVRVHAKDWEYDPYGSFVRENIPRFNGTVIGKGLVPIREILQKLKKDNFDGKVVLEINAGKITTVMLDESANFLRSEMNV